MKPQQLQKCHVLPDEWKRHFDQLYNFDISSHFDLTHPEIRGQHDDISTQIEPQEEVDAEISLVEKTKVIAKSPNKKAPGPDGVTNEFLKSSFGMIYPFY